MRIVLDTNVLVSGLLSPFGAPGDIVMMTAAGVLEVCYDGRILSEYREVLLRPKFGFKEDDIEEFLEQVESCGYAAAPKPLIHRLPDLSDEPFLEIALGGKVSCLISGNLKHYPVKSRKKMPVISPADFITTFYPQHSSREY